jgi:hypothetical protein
VILGGSSVATERSGHRFVAAAAKADVAAAHGDEGGVPALEACGGVVNVAINLQALVNAKRRET